MKPEEFEELVVKAGKHHGDDITVQFLGGKWSLYKRGEAEEDIDIVQPQETK